MLSDLTLIFIPRVFEIKNLRTWLKFWSQINNINWSTCINSFWFGNCKLRIGLESLNWWNSLNFSNGFTTNSHAFFCVIMKWCLRVIFNFIKSIHESIDFPVSHQFNNSLTSWVKIFYFTKVINEIIEKDIILNWYLFLWQ